MKTIKGLLTTGIVVALLCGTASGASAETLGWSEDGGTQAASISARAASQPKHTGAAEEKDISGTTHKRAHGWTTWSGVYHYTRARLEKGSTINGDSGRRWGTNGTEAISPWKPYTVRGDLVSPGSARTYYGK